MAELSDMDLLESTAVLRVPEHMPQVTSVTVLHTDVRGIASGRVREPLGQVARFDEVWVIEAFGELELPVPSLNVLLRQVHDPTFL